LGKKDFVFGGIKKLSFGKQKKHCLWGELKLTDNKKGLFFGEKRFCLWGKRS
jgi:hypothetical protein